MKVLILAFLFPQGGDDPRLAALQGGDATARAMAARRLAAADRVPEGALVGLLGHSDPVVRQAAAQVLSAKGLAPKALREFADSAPLGTTDALLRHASVDGLRRLLRQPPEARARSAAYALCRRGALTDKDLGFLLASVEPGLLRAGLRICVYARPAFPVGMCRPLLRRPAARRQLLALLAECPRRQADPLLKAALAMPGLDPMERIQALSALPSQAIGPLQLEQILTAAEAEDAGLNNQAAVAAQRLDGVQLRQLFALVLPRLGVVKDARNLCSVLEGIGRESELQLCERALGLGREAQAHVFHWLEGRQSPQVGRYLSSLILRGAVPAPTLISALGPQVENVKLRTILLRWLADPEADEALRLACFGALMAVEFYHPAMLTFALDDPPEGRRLWRLLQIPWQKLPPRLFAILLQDEARHRQIWALQSLTRGPLHRSLEQRVMAWVRDGADGTRQAAAARLVLKFGREPRALETWAEVKDGRLRGQALKWLMQSPKPWSYDILLRERQRLRKLRDPQQPGVLGAAEQGVLVALARIGDRGSQAQLLDQLPQLDARAMASLRQLLAEKARPGQLRALADRFFPPGKAAWVALRKPQHRGYLDEPRRVELLEFLVEQKGLELRANLEATFAHTESFELRLVALRGLLRKADCKFLDQLRPKLFELGDEESEELMFELVGSVPIPIPAPHMDLLAELILRRPLLAPRQEVGFSLRPDLRGARGVYPLLLPVANLLRRAETARPQRSFQRAARRLGPLVWAVNRQRLGAFMSSIMHRQALADDLAPVLSRMILAAPDPAPNFVAPAQQILGEQAEIDGDDARAAELYEAAFWGYLSENSPYQIRRVFLGESSSLDRRQPLAALRARALLCRARLLPAKDAAGLLRAAADLAEGDAPTSKDIHSLRNSLERDK